MIQVQQVYKYFDDKCVNDNISLEIKQGTIYGLLGPNGAGKTTLIRMLATVTKADKGKILFQNEPLSTKHIPFIGYMPEERGLYRKMTVVDQLLYFAELKGIKRSDAKQEVKHWMNKLDIVEWADKKMEELSKGMAQKIQFVSTILHKPTFLILDEPFSGFDPVNADMVKDLIIDMKNQGTTILFSTHRMDNVEELCDQIAIIHQGKMILDGEIQSVRRSFFKNEYDLTFSSSDVSIPSHFNLANPVKTSANRSEYRIQLTESQSPQELLNFAYNTKSLIGFQEFVPSIHQIFVNQVSTK